MQLVIRFAAPLLVALAVLTAALTPVADNLVGQWFQRDLQLRARLIFSALTPSLVGLINSGDFDQVGRLFDAVAQDERVLAVGWCTRSTAVRVSGKAWPETLACPTYQTNATHSETVADGTIFLTSFPLPMARDISGSLVVLHDVSFIAQRSLVAQLYLMGFLGLFSIVAAAVTMATAHFTLRGWVKTVRGFLVEGVSAPGASDADVTPMIGEIRQLIRDLDVSGQTTNSLRIDWSPESLRRVVSGELAGSQVIVVSNREPYIHSKNSEGNITLQRPASGMVTALEPVMRACGGTWIAHGSGTADREMCDSRDRIAVPPADPAYTLKRVWLSDAEQDGYYYGLANEGLWPLCHITFVRPVFRESDWAHYQAVNRKFAEAVIAEATSPDPVILIQDYHFALLPKLIKERLPRATIITFWHIPWPNAEVFGICPWREAVLNGLLGSSIIGFHTQLHCINFIEAADRFIESHIDREDSTISISGQRTLVRPYPISIAWPPEAMSYQAPIHECRQRIFAQYNLSPQSYLVVGVERFDFTKGIPDRFRAVEILLQRHPELIGRFVLLQIAAPTRSKLQAYEDIKHEATQIASQINERFGSATYSPIVLVCRHHEPEQVFEAFRAADCCIVSSLHDGMNLVAKEFVAARDDEQGVLILSTFAGASRELMEALIVNPFDARATAETIFRATRMSVDDQGRRMRLMRHMISENNIYYWAGRMLLDAARIRKRAQLESTLVVATSGGRRSA